ncbi:MAG TPA: hypothetical protein DCP90_04540 [Clostridiales bacterium]|nr:MAG: hypothetical protein A2Y22_06725 [Clostridiales bacterium GWD2_32_59]HAN09864.1 hypothetical protein [Clostridiales bacterium]
MKRFIIQSNAIRIILITLFWLSIYQMLYMYINNDIYIPSIQSILKETTDIFTNKEKLIDIIFTLGRMIIGTTISIVAAIVIAVICGSKNYMFEFIKPAMAILKTAPSIVLILISLIWFDAENLPVIICVAMCLPIMFSNIVYGILNIDKVYIDFVKVYNIKRKNVYSYLYVSLLKPYFISGVNTIIGISFKVIIATEILALPDYGIGKRIYDSKLYLKTDEMLAWTVIVIIASLLIEKYFNKFIRKKVEVIV